MTRSRCTNPMHDHDECAGAEVRDDTAPASATRHGDGVAVLTEPAPMTCAHCAKPLHYDRGAETYRHDDLDAECFLHAAGLPEGATPCTLATVDPRCTGAADEDGTIAHDGPTCPIHEASPSLAAHGAHDDPWRGAHVVGDGLTPGASAARQTTGEEVPTDHDDL